MKADPATQNHQYLLQHHPGWHTGRRPTLSLSSPLASVPFPQVFWLLYNSAILAVSALGSQVISLLPLSSLPLSLPTNPLLSWPTGSVGTLLDVSDCILSHIYNKWSPPPSLAAAMFFHLLCCPCPPSGKDLTNDLTNVYYTLTRLTRIRENIKEWNRIVWYSQTQVSILMWNSLSGLKTMLRTELCPPCVPVAFDMLAPVLGNRLGKDDLVEAIVVGSNEVYCFSQNKGKCGHTKGWREVHSQRRDIGEHTGEAAIGSLEIRLGRKPLWSIVSELWKKYVQKKKACL